MTACLVAATPRRWSVILPNEPVTWQTDDQLPQHHRKQSWLWSSDSLVLHVNQHPKNSQHSQKLVLRSDESSCLKPRQEFTLHQRRYFGVPCSYFRAWNEHLNQRERELDYRLSYSYFS
ncbi:hypothetical protein TKK_0012957 [Trichogramma kaykai]